MKKARMIRSAVALTMVALCLAGCTENNSSNTEEKRESTAIDTVTTELVTEPETESETEPETESKTEPETSPPLDVEDIGFKKAESMEEVLEHLLWYTPYEEYHQDDWNSIQNLNELYDVLFEKRMDIIIYEDEKLEVQPVWFEVKTFGEIVRMYNRMYPNESYGAIVIQNEENEVFWNFGPFDEKVVQDARCVAGIWEAIWLTDFGKNRTIAEAEESCYPVTAEERYSSNKDRTEPDKNKILTFEEVMELVKNGEKPRLWECGYIESYPVEDRVKLYLTDGRKLTSCVAGLQMLALDKGEIEYATSFTEELIHVQELWNLENKIYENELNKKTSHRLYFSHMDSIEAILENYILYEFSPVLVRSHNSGELFIICGYTPNAVDKQYDDFFDKVWVLSSESISPISYSYDEFIEKYGKSSYETLWFENYYEDSEGKMQKD